MLVIPAIDIKDGKCVRLFEGRFETAKVYYKDPVDVALLFRDLGARRIHVVDLDGARGGRPVNARVIERIVEKSGLTVEAGGGIRDKNVVESFFEMGVSFVVIGTMMVENFKGFSEIAFEFPKKIIAAIDGRKGVVVTRGWQKEEKLTIFDLAKKVEKLPIESVLFTEVTRDGTLSGVERELTRKLAESIDKPVIASGGVSSLEDIKKIKELEPLGVMGVIVGKAFYEGRIDLRKAFEVADAG